MATINTTEKENGGKLDAFGIQLTADRSVYSPGDVVTGEVVLELRDATKVKGKKKQHVNWHLLVSILVIYSLHGYHNH